jgi:tetratricopeptide (TPR) repeat protein
MKIDRLAALQQFAADSPQDPFNHYALALEYQRLGDLALAESLFSRLIADFPTYVPTYYHFGKFRESQGLLDEALRLYSQGIEVAVAAQDAHAARELREAHSLLEALLD